MKPRETSFSQDKMDWPAKDDADTLVKKEIFEKVKNPEELSVYLRDNLEYGFVGKNDRKLHTPGDSDWNDAFLKEYYLQTPDELLSSKHGVCWDSVELERDWFLKHNFEFKTFYLGFKKEADNDLPTHTFLAYKNNDKWYWFEQSFADHRGIHEYNDLPELIKDVSRKHFDYAIKNRGAITEDINDLKYCEYERPKPGCSAEEFVSTIFENNPPIDLES
jgi:Transglutaminase-like domain.